MNKVTLGDAVFERYLAENEILEAIEAMATELIPVFESLSPLILVVLNGSFIFAAEVIRHFHFPLEIEFIRYQSYQGSVSTSTIHPSLRVEQNVKGRHVLILEDIVDSGLTLAHIVNELDRYEPKSVKVATLLFKPEAWVHGPKPDFVGRTVGLHFLVGFGLDYNGWGRNLRDIYRLENEVILNTTI